VTLAAVFYVRSLRHAAVQRELVVVCFV